jgi:thioesterase domain-containing protein
VIGELFIGGVQVARGYCNRPALTAERFVADPFGGTGARLYRTGDRVRWRANGTLEYVGRIDFQTKIRGVRIELGEIETRLAQHPAVREAVVLAREDTPGERRLVAYVVGDETAGADVLRAHLSETLPDYMVPAAYVRLGSLPLTASGKVDRRALPAPDSHAYARRGYEPPLGETEEVVARIWAEVLRIERVGRTDHFFELGGYSLLAVQMLARVREELGVNVPAGGVFAWPMLADFARELTSPSQVDLPPMEPVAQRGRIPLSFPQHRLWSLERNAGVGAARRVSMRFRMKGGLDQVALIAALEGIVARHEALRTTVVEVDGVPEQRIAPATTRFTLVEDDLRGEMNAQAELRRLLIEEARIPFDLAQGPLVRGRLIRTDEDDHVLAVTMHPMIADGWSTGIFAKELTARYGALHRGEPDPLSRPALQYADYALWQRRSVAGDALKAQAQYWKDTLEGAPEVLELPTDQPRPARPDYAGARVAVELDPTQTRELRALAHRHQVTVFMALLAGWGIVLHRLSGQDDVVIGSPTANRRRREIQGIIGAFENTLALRLNLSGKPTVGDLLAQVKARTVEAHLHQDIPFEEVVELVRPARSFSHTPVFQAMFLWRNAPTPEVAFPGLEVAPVTALEPPVAPESASQTAARFDLTLALAERGERIAGSLTYASALFERETVERHVGHLRHVLEAMAANDQLTADAFSLDAGDTRETARAGGHGRPVTIRAAGSQTPLFLVHEGTWSTAHAQVLEPHIGNDMPVYVLPAPSSAEAPARTIEEMATQLVRMIHEIRPGGPYRVAGWSSSGVLAYEIATQLLGEDEVVEFVGMFDGEFPGGPAGFGDVEGRRVLGDAVRGYIPQPIPAPVHRALSDVIARPRKIEKTPLAAADSFILKLQSGKRGVAPILCVPGAGTSITSYIDLSAVLDPSWPVYGLQPRGMDGTTVPHSTVSAAARHYLRAIEETWPDGPIHLLGHSFGGWIAFEIALRLRASGRSIGSLTIVDSEVPETDARSYDVDSALAFIKLVEVVELSAERSFGIARADVDAKDERGRLKLLHRKMVQHGLLNARSTDENVLYGPSRVFARCIRTVYRPSGRYPDRVRLVLANDPKLDEAANRDQLTNVVRGWKQWAPGLVVSTSTGNHVTALKAPHVATLGRYLVEDRSEVTIER